MSNSRVLLIGPQVDYARMFGKASTTAPSMVPLNLLYLSAYLESRDIPVKILDGQIHDLDKQSLVKSKFDPVDNLSRQWKYCLHSE